MSLKPGEELHRARTTAGLSRFQLAVALGVTTNTIYNVETGHRSMPVHKYVRALELCGVTLQTVPHDAESVIA